MAPAVHGAGGGAGEPCHYLAGGQAAPAGDLQWRDPAATEANIAWARDTFEALRPYMSARRYVNNLRADDG